jgi:NAD-dependent dihydropyrimidine dehydrogenase PreA subunit
LDERVLPTIDLDICTGCGLCIDRCPTHAVEMGAKGRPSIVRPEDCAYCGLCEEMCPEGAIALSYEIVVAPDPPNGAH